MNEPTAEEVQKMLAGWAKQTVIFAMNIRAADLGKSTSDADHMRFAAGEAQRLVEQWLKDAWDEAPKPIEMHKLVMPFVRKTLYWSRDHLS